MKIHSRNAFTLVEIAMVLAVMGVIFGSIWAAASSASSSRKYFLASQQIMAVVQNIRDLYRNAEGLPVETSDRDVTKMLAGKEVFLAEMRIQCGADICINSPISSAPGGSFRVIGTEAGTASGFRVVLTNLPREACIKLLLSGVSFKDQSLGVKAFCGSQDGSGTPCTATSTTAWNNIACDLSTGLCGECPIDSNGACSSAPTTLTATRAKLLCSNATKNQAGWEFTLRK